MEDKKSIKGPVILSVIITFICTSILGIIIYFVSKPTLTIVFYDVECIEMSITENYKEEFVCAYFRLNSKENHRINVKDFSILSNGKYEEATNVEYFNQNIRTNFETYPNQPTLKVYFRVPHSAIEKVTFVKYKKTSMRIGEFVKTK